MITSRSVSMYFPAKGKRMPAEVMETRRRGMERRYKRLAGPGAAEVRSLLQDTAVSTHTGTTCTQRMPYMDTLHQPNIQFG